MHEVKSIMRCSNVLRHTTLNKFIKDCQDITLPKLNRLIPYLETFITLSHLQFILKNPSRNSPDKNPFVFEQKFISGKYNEALIDTKQTDKYSEFIPFSMIEKLNSLRNPFKAF